MRESRLDLRRSSWFVASLGLLSSPFFLISPFLLLTLAPRFSFFMAR
jgi:hypothetical protein